MSWVLTADLYLIRHIMTGIGSYFYIVWAIYLRHCLTEKQDTYVLSWPSFLSVPEVIPRSVTAEINGHSKDTSRYRNGVTRNNDRKSV
jgi:dihydroceramidase